MQLTWDEVGSDGDDGGGGEPGFGRAECELVGGGGDNIRQKPELGEFVPLRREAGPRAEVQGTCVEAPRPGGRRGQAQSPVTTFAGALSS